MSKRCMPTECPSSNVAYVSETNMATASTVAVAGPARSATATMDVLHSDFVGAQTTRPSVALAPLSSTRHTSLRMLADQSDQACRSEFARRSTMSPPRVPLRYNMRRTLQDIGNLDALSERHAPRSSAG